MNIFSVENRKQASRRFLLVGAAIILGVLMWLQILPWIELEKSSGWAMVLLADCLGMNLLALGFYGILVRIGFRTGLLSQVEKNRGRNRAVKLFFSLIALSVGILAGYGLIRAQLQGLMPSQFRTGIILGDLFSFPLLVVALLILAMLVLPLVKRAQSAFGTRPMVYVEALLAALIPVLLVSIDAGYAPLFELISYEWFTSLRRPQIPPENDLIVVNARTKDPLRLVRTFAKFGPRKIVVVTDTGMTSPQAFETLDALANGKNKILMTSIFFKNTATKFSNLQFAKMSHMVQPPMTMKRDEDENLTSPFLLARERNPMLDFGQLRGYEDEDGLMMYENYSRWRTVVTTIDVQDEIGGWVMTLYPVGKRYFSFHISDEEGIDANVGDPSSRWTLDSLKGKTLIFDFYTQIAPVFLNEPQIGLHGSKIARILMNIERNDFIRRVSYQGIGLIALMVLLANILCYYRLEPWPAIGIALTLNSVFFAAAVVLYAEWSILIFTTPIIASVGFFTIVLFPYELVRERSRQLEERTRLSTELQTARDMQMGLMPANDPIVIGYDISGSSKPSGEVGGDYFDYLWMNEEKTKLGIAIADVSGKAMKAAITAVMTSGMIYREIGNNQSPKEILKKINTPMFLKTQKNTFTAMSIAVIDTKTKTLTLSNAGQTHPILKRGEETRFLKVEGTHFPLGIIEEVEYQELTVPLRAGDLIVFYTDGIPEATNEQSELFGFDRLEQRIKQLTNETAKEAIQAIVEEAEKVARKAKQHDDMTVVVVRVI